MMKKLKYPFLLSTAMAFIFWGPASMAGDSASAQAGPAAADSTAQQNERNGSKSATKEKKKPTKAQLKRVDAVLSEVGLPLTQEQQTQIKAVIEANGTQKELRATLSKEQKAALKEAREAKKKSAE